MWAMLGTNEGRARGARLRGVALLVVLLLALISLPAAAQGVSDRELFGVEGGAAETPADPPPTRAPAPDEPRRRRGVNADGERNVEVRTGFSPREVKREPTPEERAAQREAERRQREVESNQQLMNGLLIFLGVVLLVLVLGGMAYAAFMFLFDKPGDDPEPPTDGEGAYDHLVQRDPTPASVRTPSATPAPVPKRGIDTPPSVASRHPDTPASVPSRYPARSSSGSDLRSRAAAGREDPPSIAPTPTPVPVVASRPLPDPTPASYVPPVRPEAGSPDGGSSRPASPSMPRFDPSPPVTPQAFVSFDGPPPLETPDGPVYLPPKATPVPTFSTVEETSTPAPRMTSPPPLPPDRTADVLSRRDWTPTPPPTDGLDADFEDDEVIVPTARGPHDPVPTQKPPPTPMVESPDPDEPTVVDQRALDPWSMPSRDPSATHQPRPRVPRKVAVPPRMPWRKDQD